MLWVVDQTSHTACCWPSSCKGSRPFGHYQISGLMTGSELILLRFMLNAWLHVRVINFRIIIIIITNNNTTTTSFNGLFSRTSWVSRRQKGKPFWILLDQEMTEWQWHQLDHMHIIFTSLQTDNHASTSPLSFYRPDALPATQPTASKHWRQIIQIIFIY